jgi:release factor glutamine methyltransferase
VSAGATVTAHQRDSLVTALRRAGCVFAEEEASILRESARDTGELERFLARRIAGEPLEHIVGWVEFAGRRLSVGPGVFVPRKRSEMIAAVTIAHGATVRRPLIVEAFSGVAPIAATAQAWLPDADVHATDIDDRALRYARRNLLGHGHVHRGDGLSGLPTCFVGAVSVIAAVPPYVPDAAIDLMPREAADHEPRAALTAGADGLDHIRGLVAAASRYLADDGVLALEMNLAQAPAAAALAPDARTEVIEGPDGQTAVLLKRW